MAAATVRRRKQLRRRAAHGFVAGMMHAGQLEVDQDSVRQLLDDQFAQWRDLPVREVQTTGTVNAIFRIGDGLAARLPLHPQDPEVVHGELTAEAEAAAELAANSTMPTPVPVAIGAPGHGYPLPWSVQTWLPGRDATVEDPAASVEFACDLAGFITELRAVDTRGRSFSGSGRGGHLPDHDSWMEECFVRSVHLLDVPRLRRLWDGLRALPEADPDVMCHGDLTPANVLVREGRLSGVLDTGQFAAADPALDLVSAWHLLDDVPRMVLRDTLRCSEIQWLRGMAWAFQQSIGLVWYYTESNPVMSAWGRRTLERLLTQGVT